MEFQLRQSSSSSETPLLREEMSREKPRGVQGAEIVILGLRNDDENGTDFTLLGTISIPLEGEVKTSIYSLQTHKCSLSSHCCSRIRNFFSGSAPSLPQGCLTHRH